MIPQFKFLFLVSLLFVLAKPLSGQTSLPPAMQNLKERSEKQMKSGDPQTAILLAESLVRHARDSFRTAADIRIPQLLEWLGGQYLIAGQYQEAAASSREGLDLLLKHHPKNTSAIAAARHDLALVLLEIGAGEEAADQLSQAMNLQKGRNKEYAKSLEQLAGLELLRGNDKSAERHFNLLLHIQDSLLGAESPELARTLNNLASIHQQRGLDETAKGMYLQALNLQYQALGKQSIEASTTLTNLAVLHDNQGDFEQAKELLLQAFNIRKAHPKALEMYWAGLDNLVSLYLKHDKQADALALLRQTEQEILQREGAFSMPMASLMDRFATYCIALQDGKSAQAFFLKSLEIRESLLGTYHLDLAPNLYNLGKLENSMNQPDQARIHLQWAMEVFSTHQMGNEAQVTAILSELFNTDYIQGKLEDAENDLLMMREIKSQIYGEGHPETLAVMQEQARFLRLSGREAEAELLEAQIISKTAKKP